MDMQIYLSEIEYAATDFISLIWKETEAAVQLEAELKRLTEATGRDYGQVESLALMDDDDDNLATGLYWDTYFGVDKERHHKAEDVGAAGDRIALHEFSVSVAAGSVLQCAKQGLSMDIRSLHAGQNGQPSAHKISATLFDMHAIRRCIGRLHSETPSKSASSKWQ